MLALCINVGQKLAERQPSFPRNLFESLPELLLHGEARLALANADRPFLDGGPALAHRFALPPAAPFRFPLGFTPAFA